MSDRWYIETASPFGTWTPSVLHVAVPDIKTSGKTRRLSGSETSGLRVREGTPKKIDPEHFGLSLTQLREIYGPKDPEAPAAAMPNDPNPNLPTPGMTLLEAAEIALEWAGKYKALFLEEDDEQIDEDHGILFDASKVIRRESAAANRQKAINTEVEKTTAL